MPAIDGETVMRSPAWRAASALAVAAAMLAAGCGAPPKSTAFRDPTYKRDPLKLERFAMAPVPIAGPRGEGLDRGMERAFSDTPGVLVRNQPSVMRQRMNGDRDLLWSVNRLMAAKYTAEDFAAGPSVQALLTAKQIDELRRVTGDAVLFLLPVEMTTTPAGSATRAHGMYRVYNMESGRLVLQSTVDTSVPESGESGDLKALVQLVLKIQEDFRQRLMN